MINLANFHNPMLMNPNQGAVQPNWAQIYAPILQAANQRAQQSQAYLNQLRSRGPIGNLFTQGFPRLAGLFGLNQPQIQGYGTNALSFPMQYGIGQGTQPIAGPTPQATTYTMIRR